MDCVGCSFTTVLLVGANLMVVTSPMLFVVGDTMEPTAATLTTLAASISPSITLFDQLDGSFFPFSFFKVTFVLDKPISKVSKKLKVELGVITKSHSITG